MNSPLPKFLQTCLWSYDISNLDINKDKYLIITQIINYGDKKQLKWMENNYSSEETRAVVIHPRRGVWWRDRLRTWLKKYGLMIDPLRFEVAVRENELRPVSLMNEFFKRVDQEKNETTRRYS